MHFFPNLSPTGCDQVLHPPLKEFPWLMQMIRKAHLCICSHHCLPILPCSNIRFLGSSRALCSLLFSLSSEASSMLALVTTSGLRRCCLQEALLTPQAWVHQSYTLATIPYQNSSHIICILCFLFTLHFGSIRSEPISSELLLYSILAHCLIHSRCQ